MQKLYVLVDLPTEGPGNEHAFSGNDSKYGDVFLQNPPNSLNFGAPCGAISWDITCEMNPG